ncbi:O-antigen ligase [Agromyces sp. Leaf222]|uniref:O-antigen ligase family protein n=1 Tax=Agromyces sp. Leaf222 TaxID=1735688 RepID=UPI0006F3D469|nr:O-antigen ligase family protein [Agromyces sp. Leaf222]KQM81442.1 hypothetical protein ASE68_16915 [Agromyces sp. Leaf222]
MLSVYVVLLCVIPSGLTITVLASLGWPSLLWGLLLAFWWAVHQLMVVSRPVEHPSQPVRLVFAGLVLVALVSFAAAMLRGQPVDQVSPAMTSLLRLVSLGGVLFVAVDGIRTLEELRRLVNVLVVVVSLVAVLGLAQFVTGQEIIDAITIPGMSVNESGGAQVRGAFVRAVGTAINPLEYAALLCMVFPFALAFALRTRPGPRLSFARAVRLLPLALISIATLISASRSALLGLLVAIVGMLPALSRKLRTGVVIGGLMLAAIVMVAVPGMFSTMLAQFVEVDDDPSAQSRTNALAKLPDFIAASPFVGTGFGTFLSRYYIFDNAWALWTIELGILGLVGLLSLVCCAMWSAFHARTVTDDPEIRLLGQAAGVSVLTAAVIFAGFDGFSFPISSGLFFVCVGLCAAVRSVAAFDAAAKAGGPVGDLAEDHEIRS